MRSIIGVALTSVAILPSAYGQTQLIVNGVPNPPVSTNDAVPHLKKGGELTIELRGKPNAPFALLLSGDANDGSPGEPFVLNGFFLKPWVDSQAQLFDSPIHPVLDGIGTDYIRQSLNGQGLASLGADDLLPDVPSPLFKFDAQGKFSLSGEVPLSVALINLLGNPTRLQIPLESTQSQTIALYMQIVEFDVASSNVVVGNGVKLVFDPLTFEGDIAYAEGTDPIPGTTNVTHRVVPSTIADANLADGSPASPVSASDFAFATAGLDFWMICLGGNHELYDASNPPNNFLGISNPNDPDAVTTMQAMQSQASGIDVFATDRVARNNENREFPRIMLPGNRELFHWRDAATNQYGFGILFRDTNTWRNLTPLSANPSDNFAFTNLNPNISPWEYEISVTPDGNRAIAVLDQNATSTDRVFVMNLEPNGVFSNGKPIFEAAPLLGDGAWFTRVFEESISIASDGQGGWVTFFGTSNSSTQGLGGYPVRIYRTNVADSGAVPSLVQAPTIQRLDRMMIVSPDRTKVAFVAGTVSQSLASQNEDVYVIDNITANSQTVSDVTGVVGTFSIGESNESSNGALGLFRFAPDGSRIAFAREFGTTQRLLRTVATDGSEAGTTADLIVDLAQGGPFDLLDFPVGRDFQFSKDGEHVVFFQGAFASLGLLDRMDLFTVDLTTTVVRNLTRTGGSGVSGTPFTALGPWDPPSVVSEFRPNIEAGGSFKSANGDYLYEFRELRGVVGQFDRQNLIALSIAPAGPGLPPSFEIVNITGTEFEAIDGAPVPTTGAPDMHTGGTLALDAFPEYHKVRRMGGTGPYSEHMLFVGRLGNVPLGDPREDVDQLWAFDPENPAPATVLTSFVQGQEDGSGQLVVDSTNKVSKGARISSVRGSPSSGRVLFVMQNGISGALSDDKQDLMLTALTGLPTPNRVPQSALPFTRIITAGSAMFGSDDIDGIVFCAGTLPRETVPGQAATIDSVSVTSDLQNATDVTPYFYRTIAPTSLSAILPLTSGSRGATIFHLK